MFKYKNNKLNISSKDDKINIMYEEIKSSNSYINENKRISCDDVNTEYKCKDSIIDRLKYRFGTVSIIDFIASCLFVLFVLAGAIFEIFMIVYHHMLFSMC